MVFAVHLGQGLGSCKVSVSVMSRTKSPTSQVSSRLKGSRARPCIFQVLYLLWSMAVGQYIHMLHTCQTLVT